MKWNFSSNVCVALIAITLQVAGAPAYAVPLGGPVRSHDSMSRLDQVQYRGHFGNRRFDRHVGDRYRRNGGRNLALGIGGLVIGGIVLSEAARSAHRREYRSEWERCAASYRSFEPETGMYTGYDGDRHICPYLR